MNLSRRHMLAATLAIAVAACASQPGEKKETAGQYIDDATVTAKVKTAIATDVGARAAANVNVETYRGVVQLTGFVASPEQAERAAAAAKKVEGVRSVRNDVRIKS
jgi:osmotically-inducible protein OsmY